MRLQQSYICLPSRLLASSPTAMPLRLQYDSAEPNSIPNWLERWSASLLQEPIAQKKKVPASKLQKKQSNPLNIDNETGRVKQSIRRNPPSNLENVSTQRTSEFEKPKRNFRKVASHPYDSIQESPQNEFEKVKRNLRKVHNPNTESDAGSEKPKYVPTKFLSSSCQKPTEESITDSSEKIKNRGIATDSKLPDIEAVLEPLVVKEDIELLLDDEAAVEPQPLDNSGQDQSIPVINGELSSREDPTVDEREKKSAQKASFTEQEYEENGIQNRRMLPSYMAATESAKAKLRAQGSTRLGQDGIEKQSLTRRHSLPASTNGKVVSPWPRAQRPVQVGGKGGNRIERSLLSSRDGNVKIVQPEWRR